MIFGNQTIEVLLGNVTSMERPRKRAQQWISDLIDGTVRRVYSGKREIYRVGNHYPVQVAVGAPAWGRIAIDAIHCAAGDSIATDRWLIDFHLVPGSLDLAEGIYTPLDRVLIDGTAHPLAVQTWAHHNLIALDDPRNAMLCDLLGRSGDSPYCAPTLLTEAYNASLGHRGVPQSTNYGDGFHQYGERGQR